MKALMVDDHVMFLQGLKNLLGVLAPDLAVDTASSVALAVQHVQLADYDLVLLDWHLADCDGDVAIEQLRDAGCRARIVVLSGETGAALIRSSVDCGAAGFIPKSYSSERMIDALDRVLQGRIFLPQELLESGAATDAIDVALAALTPRQADVYRAAIRGLPNKLIARELGIGEATVKTHLAAVFACLGVRNRTEAAYRASRLTAAS